MDKFSNKCCQCGMCCLSETCPIGQKYFSIDKKGPCPGLRFEKEKAFCSLAEVFNHEVLGIGKGCCIKAQAYRDGEVYDFASLPDFLKFRAVNDLLKKKGKDRG